MIRLFGIKNRFCQQNLKNSDHRLIALTHIPPMFADKILFGSSLISSTVFSHTYKQDWTLNTGYSFHLRKTTIFEEKFQMDWFVKNFIFQKNHLHGAQSF